MAYAFTDTDLRTLRARLAEIAPSFWGKVFYYGLPFRKRVVLENMRQVFGEVLNRDEIQRLAVGFYTHIARSLAENVMMRFMSPEKIAKRVRVEGVEHVLKVAEANQGVLILTGHFGNWEFAPIGGIMNFAEFKGRFHFIRKMLKVKWLEKLLFWRYYAAGLQVIPKKNSLNQVCDALEKNDGVIFVMDQHAPVDIRIGLPVEFFGKTAGTYRSLATIACSTQVPVIPAASYREADGQHVLAFYDPIAWEDHDNYRQALLNNTRAYNAALEKLVLAHPEQWLWMHKRWKVAA